MRLHPDVDLLALHALGEPVLDAAARDHVGACPRCSTTVTELAGTVLAVRGPAHEVGGVDRVPAPAHVWQGISSELGLDPAVRPTSVGPSSLRAGVRGDARPDGPAGEGATAPHPTAPAHQAGVPATAAAAQPGTPVPAPDAGVTDLAARRPRRPGLRLLAVAAAGLVVGAAGTAVVAPRLGGAPAVPQQTVLAAADLEAFGAGEGTDAQGSARLSTLPGVDSDDDRVLQVWLDQLPDSGDAFYEAWLIDPDTGAMVSLGPVRTGGPGEVTAELAVPRGLDVAAYDVVDVSAEPLDGDPRHSGVSLVRGTLGT